MFDDYARELFRDYSDFEGLVGEDAARALSRAYLATVHCRVNGVPDDKEELTESQPFLRRLANTLFFHVVLDESRSLEERQAAAFVASEAISLIVEFLAVSQEQANASDGSRDVRSAERFTRIEAALLYLFARYDACAAGVLAKKLRAPESNALVDLAAEWCLRRLESLCRLRLFPSMSADDHPPLSDAASLNPRQLEEDTVARLYIELGRAAADFAVWLTDCQSDGLALALERVKRVLRVLSLDMHAEESPCGYDHSRVFHLATLLRLAFPALGDRALVHVVPAPREGDAAAYRRYLESRAAGSHDAGGRALLWPSALEYVQQCVVGRTRHAVASMPTGSGKSFVAEIAVSQEVQNGWVLYLAPTNALTQQIRGDLRSGLEALGSEVFAFIGDQEYSILTGDRVEKMPDNSVAVMTPEKCALALRLSPETFSNCRLVVFDECQLIGDKSTRGPVSELVITQLMLRVPECRFLLLSAIVQNPQDLAQWLGSATAGPSGAVTLRWRPTRSLRAVLGVDDESVQERAADAKEKLDRRPERIKRWSFDAQCAIAANLQGAWKSDDSADYAVSPLDCEARLKLVRRKVGTKWRYHYEKGDSWVNGTATVVGTTLANRGIQTIVFTPRSKHDPFSIGNKAVLRDGVLESLSASPELVNICRILAKYELGCDSQVFELLERGVAVHTSAMLEVEKIASEAAFRSRSVPVMFATGTLAQGLNLPAIAVVIAGSQIGDERGEETEELERRRASQLLNAAGRAGRAGFANQGLVVAVPRTPVAFGESKALKKARDQVDYLQQSDDAVETLSGLSKFLDSVCKQTLRSDDADDIELQVISLVAGGDRTQIDPESILKGTYAAHLRRQAGKSEVTEADVDQLVHIGTEFVAQTGAPDWLTIAAQRAGLDFFLTFAISRAWERVRPQLPLEAREWTVVQWRDEFLRLIVHVPPGILTAQLPRNSLRHISSAFRQLSKESPQMFFPRDLSWQPDDAWIAMWATALEPLDAWMSGRSYAELAGILTGASAESISSDRTSGKPIPKAISVSNEAWSSLALIAGGFLAVAEQVWDGDVPMSLACLPMCMKYGCESREVLAWFRFGVRLRRPARLLAAMYPPPPADSDDDLREWVRRTRREWLDLDDDDEPIELSAARAFIYCHP